MKYKDVFQGRLFTVPNILTLSRLVLLVPFLYFVLRYQKNPNLPDLIWILAIGSIGSMTDYLDGILARKLNQESIFGRYLDGISDKIIAIATLSIMTYHFHFPIWIYIVYLVREIGGFWLVWFLFARKNQIAHPNIWGKLGVNVAVWAVFWYIAVPYLQMQPNVYWLWLRPEISAYVFFAVIVIGILDYAFSYLPMVFSGSRFGQHRMPSDAPDSPDSPDSNNSIEK